MRFLTPSLIGVLGLAGLVTAAPAAVAAPPTPQHVTVVQVAPAAFAGAEPGSFAEAVGATPTAFAEVATMTPSYDPPPDCYTPGPWEVHAKAVNLRRMPSTSSTVLGVLYPSQHFTVHSTAKGWVNLTDRGTGVRGWASATYVYRDGGLCLD